MLSQLDDAILDPKLATHLIRAGAEETFAKPFASIIWMLRGFRAGRLELNVYHCSAAMTAFHRAERWMGANPAISSSCQAKRWDLACEILWRASSARAVDRISHNSAFCLGVGMWQRALGLLDATRRQVEPDSITINSVINTCTSRSWPVACGLVGDMRYQRLPVTEITCGAALKVCQQWTRACSFMEFMTRSALKINVIVGHTVLAALTLGSIWRFTLRQAFRLQECGNLDCKAIVASIDSMSKAYRWELPLSLFMLHRRDCPQNMGCVPSNAALAACGQGNGWDVVLNLFGGMAAQALVPDEITWGTLVSCLEQGARWQFALHLLACDREGLAKRSEICTNSAASCCEKACHWQSTLSLVHCLRHFRTFPGSISCNVCVSSCRNVGAWWWAVQGLVDMHSRQLVTEVSSSEATIAVARTSRWLLSLSLLAGLAGLAGADGGAAWATCMGAVIESPLAPKQRLRFLADLGSSAMISTSLLRSQMRTLAAARVCHVYIAQKLTVVSMNASWLHS
ncbi:unnamed protein product [Durusdinium trenchii]|uniref:Pentatricopeptide repeat-containing protein, chloroplastic n=1 Tax=Durusdinium trenchii TaxID=1381693 RepID=A0ABP0P322_9DINO